MGSLGPKEQKNAQMRKKTAQNGWIRATKYKNAPK
jgi:hypothetical protein